MVSNVVTGNHGDRLRAGGPTPPPVTRDSQLENLGNVIPTFHILSRYMDGDVKITPVSGPLGCQFQPHSDYPHIPSRIQGYPLTYSGMTRNERVTIFGLWRCTVCISKVASADFCIFCISIAWVHIMHICPLCIFFSKDSHLWGQWIYLPSYLHICAYLYAYKCWAYTCISLHIFNCRLLHIFVHLMHILHCIFWHKFSYFHSHISSHICIFVAYFNLHMSAYICFAYFCKYWHIIA